jgi:hypothetical protein
MIKSGEGEFVPLSKEEIGLGNCFKDALNEVGINVGDIGEWLDIDSVKMICNDSGLVCHDLESSGGNLSIEGNKPMIVIYKTRLGRAHAEYVTDFGKVYNKGYNFIAIIELPTAK